MNDPKFGNNNRLFFLSFKNPHNNLRKDSYIGITYHW